MSKIKPFFEELQKEMERLNSLLCIGINPDDAKFKKSRSILPFNRDPKKVLSGNVVRETHESVVVYKVNPFFFPDKWHLAEFIENTKHSFETPVILDARFSHTGSSAEECANVAFSTYGADAVTVNPYIGTDTLEPYLKFSGKTKGVIAIVRTLNSGSAKYQKARQESGLMLYEEVILDLLELDRKYGGNRIGLFIGSRDPLEIASIRSMVGDMTILVPRVPGKDKNFPEILKAGITPDGFGFLDCQSEGIIYEKGLDALAKTARDQINLYRPLLSK